MQPAEKKRLDFCLKFVTQRRSVVTSLFRAQQSVNEIVETWRSLVGYVGKINR